MKTKLQLKTDSKLWDRVLIFKIKNGFKNNNDAVIELIKRGLRK